MNDQKTSHFVLPAEVLNAVVENISDQKLKDSLNLYVAIQQNAKPLEAFLAEMNEEGESDNA